MVFLISATCSSPKEPSYFFLPRQDHPLKLFSPFGELQIDHSGKDWPGVLQIRTSGNGEPVQVVGRELPAFDLSGCRLVVWVKVTGLKDLRDLWIYAGSDPKLYDRIVFMISEDPGQLQENRWMRITLPFCSARHWGEPDITKLTAFQIWCRDQGRSPVLVEIGPIIIENTPRAGAVVVLTFDDGRISQLDRAAPVLQKYGLRGTAYVIPERINQPGYLSDRDLLTLQHSYGWSLGGHYMQPLAGRLEEELHALFQAHMNWFRERGVRSPDFSFPHGAFDSTLLSVVPQYFRSARTIVEYGESNPPADPYRLRITNILPGFSAEELSKRIESAKQGGDLLILVFHRIKENPEFETEISPEELETVCRLVADSGIRNATMDELSLEFRLVGRDRIADWNVATVLQPPKAAP